MQIKALLQSHLGVRSSVGQLDIGIRDPISLDQMFIFRKSQPHKCWWTCRRIERNLIHPSQLCPQILVSGRCSKPSLQKSYTEHWVCLLSVTGLSSAFAKCVRFFVRCWDKTPDWRNLRKGKFVWDYILWVWSVHHGGRMMSRWSQCVFNPMRLRHPPSLCTPPPGSFLLPVSSPMLSYHVCSVTLLFPPLLSSLLLHSHGLQSHGLIS